MDTDTLFKGSDVSAPKISKVLMGAAAVAALVLLVWTIRKSPTPEEQLTSTLIALQDEAPMAKVWVNEIPVPVEYVVKNSLPGATLATTTVRYDGVTITVDLLEVRKRNERLEPVLAHELYHAWDAYRGLGFENFVAQVELDKEKPWKDRMVEIRAVAAENAVRQHLLDRYPEKYRGMAPTRVTP